MKSNRTMPDPFETLGLEHRFDLDVKQVEERYRELSRVLHPDRHVGQPPAERRLALGKAVEVGAAVRALRDPVARAVALLRAKGLALGEREEPPASPEFLMEVLDTREELSEAKRRRELPRIERIEQRVRAWEKETTAELVAGFARADQARPDERRPLLQALLPVVAKLRYYRRLLDDLSAVQDELATSGSFSDTSAP